MTAPESSAPTPMMLPPEPEGLLPPEPGKMMSPPDPPAPLPLEWERVESAEEAEQAVTRTTRPNQLFSVRSRIWRSSAGA